MSVRRCVERGRRPQGTHEVSRPEAICERGEGEGEAQDVSQVSGPSTSAQRRKEERAHLGEHVVREAQRPDRLQGVVAVELARVAQDAHVRHEAAEEGPIWRHDVTCER